VSSTMDLALDPTNGTSKNGKKKDAKLVKR
jgi:hypothetical protein